jgi:putative ABC transport system permease protein
LTNPLISGVTISNSLLGSLASGGSETVDDKGNKLQINTARLRVDSGYLNVYGIKLLAGKNFEKPFIADTIRPVILNESAISKLGWNDPATAIGKPFRIGGQAGRVVAVVKDFHFSALQHLIGPLIIYPIDGRFSRVTLKADISQPAAVTAWVEKTWKKHFPSALLDYDFSDKLLEEQYQAEQRFARIFLYFSVLSLLIACLGLYGLIAYTTSQRVKEIGIRKVLGATVNGIAIMLSRDFLKLVLLAFLVAIPIAWIVMNKWLEDFAYRISLSWWMFAAAGIIVLLVALLTVSFRAIKAAITNPVKSLRTE